jgi:hypothetical protein
VVAKGIDIIIIILAVNIKILKTISYGLIRIEITQVFCPNFPRRFPKFQNPDKIF